MPVPKCETCKYEIQNGDIIAIDNRENRVFHTNWHKYDHDRPPLAEISCFDRFGEAMSARKGLYWEGHLTPVPNHKAIDGVDNLYGRVESGGGARLIIVAQGGIDYFNRVFEKISLENLLD